MSTIFSRHDQTHEHRPRAGSRSVSAGLNRWLHNRSRIHIGRWGERTARKILKRAGASILQVNWRDTRGEVDIIALVERRLLIVEVKTRHHGLKARYPAVRAVDEEKRTRLNRLGLSFIRNHGPLCRKLAIKSHRIDAIEVYYKRTRFGFMRVDEVSWHKGLTLPHTQKR